MKFVKILINQLLIEFPTTDICIIVSVALLVTRSADRCSLDEAFNNLPGKESSQKKFSEEEMIGKIKAHHLYFAKKCFENKELIDLIKKEMSPQSDRILKEMKEARSLIQASVLNSYDAPTMFDSTQPQENKREDEDTSIQETKRLKT